MTRTSTIPRPFLKWAGGKAQMLEQYRPYIPKQFHTYYEPFLGGGAMFFHLQPQHAVLLDINIELINAYLCVRDRTEELISHLAIHKDSHSSEHYYAVRSQSTPSNFSTIGPSVDRAARFIYLNKTCFNGLYRENKQGLFNVPMGNYANPTICEPDNLRAVAERLKFAKIIHTSFDDDKFLGKVTRQDLVYFDPPYHPVNEDSFVAYSRYAFREADQTRLRDVFIRLSARGIPVMLSNSDTPFIRNLYHGFAMHPMEAARSINSKADRRGKISELLITTNLELPQ